MATSIAFVNGVFSPIDEAKISIDDRGYYFGDGVYEVICVFNHIPFALEDHLNRLAYSMEEMGLTCPYDRDQLTALIDEACAMVEGDELLVYFQLTRGIAPRKHTYPAVGTPGSFMMTVKQHVFSDAALKSGISAKTYEDIRWGRCDIKTLNLIPNTMYTQRALTDGVDSALFVKDGMVTEFTAMSAFMVKSGTVYTHPQTHEILVGTTRRHVIDLLAEMGIPLVERAFSLGEAYAADELFCTSVIDRPTAVISLDGNMIGDGKVGPVVKKLQVAYQKKIIGECGATYFDHFIG